MATVFITDRKNDANFTVCKVEKERDADLLVYVTERRSEAKNEEAIWIYTDRKSQASVVMYFVEKERDADLLICFVDRKNHAEWNTESHQAMGQLN